MVPKSSQKSLIPSFIVSDLEDMVLITAFVTSVLYLVKFNRVKTLEQAYPHYYTKVFVSEK